MGKVRHGWELLSPWKPPTHNTHSLSEQTKTRKKNNLVAQLNDKWKSCYKRIKEKRGEGNDKLMKLTWEKHLKRIHNETTDDDLDSEKGKQPSTHAVLRGFFFPSPSRFFSQLCNTSRTGAQLLRKSANTIAITSLGVGVLGILQEKKNRNTMT